MSDRLPINHAVLSKTKRELFERRLRGEKLAVKGESDRYSSTIPRRTINKLAELSLAQERLWLFEQMNPGTTVYNLPSAVRIKGNVNRKLLELSISNIIERHESLRTSFKFEAHHPVQVISDNVNFELQFKDLSHLKKYESLAIIDQVIESDVKQPFNLTEGQLFRAVLIKALEDEYILMINMHHLISDGWSMGVFIRELKSFYEAEYMNRNVRLKELPIQYGDFAEWQKSNLQEEKLQKQLAYWNKKLQNIPVLQLPTDYSRPSIQTFAGARHYFELSKQLTDKLKQLSSQEGMTMFMTLLTALKVLVYRYTGQTDIPIGTPFANRNRPELEGLIGCFINTLVLRTELSAHQSFKKCLKAVRETTLEAFANHEVPFEQLMKNTSLQRNLSYSPLFQVMFVYQNTPAPRLEFEGMELEQININNNTSMFDFILSMEETDHGLKGFFEYNTDLFSTHTIERTTGHLKKILNEVTQNADQPIASLPILTKEEEVELVQELVHPSKEKMLTFHEMFEHYVQASPSSTALEFENQTLSYRELNEKANQVASFLRKKGVKQNSLVGICCERSMEMMIGVLGVLKAGGAYVPLDPSYPSDRLNYMMEDSGLQILLTQEQLKMPVPPGTFIVYLNNWINFENESTETLSLETKPDQLAYVIYTSGSTGKPKGVMVEHKGLYNVACEQKRLFGVTSLSKILQFASLSFDASVFEIVMALGNGAALYLAKKEGLMGEQLLEHIEQKEITHVTLPPSVLARLKERELPHLQAIITAGEACTVDIVRRWAKDRTFFNAYGPTEATIWSTVAKCEADGKEPTIGKPIQNVYIYLLDEHLQPVPKGIPGEVYIGGISLARGYLNRNDLTNERFIPNPFSSHQNEKIYKTGDLAKYLENGEIKFLGRIDHQVKIRGFRIELGEVESMVCNHESVSDAAVLLQSHQGEKVLAAYVVGDCDEQVDVSEIRTYLKSQLPDYMVPAFITVLNKLPLTPNGKIDMKQLPSIEQILEKNSDEYVPPSTSLQQKLATIWAEVLKVERIGITDHFFEVGGHSLLATQMITRIQDELNLEIPMRKLFEAPKIVDFEKVIEEFEQKKKANSRLKIVPVPRNEKLPLSFSQKRLWFLDQMEPGNAAYNIPASLKLTGVLNEKALEKSLHEMVKRHEVFRIAFDVEDGEPYQFIDENANVSLNRFDLSSLSDEEKWKEVKRLAVEEAQTSFNLTKAPLLRAILLILGQEEYVLLYTMHHIISDGWSVGIFNRELANLYIANSTGQQLNLPELKLQYIDYAYWQEKWMKDEVLENLLSYWKKQLAGKLPVLELPADYERPIVQSYHGAKETFTIEASLKEKIVSLSQKEGTTLFMTFLTAFNTLLYRLTNMKDILVGTPIAGRSQSHTENMIGFFINTLVMRTDLSGNPTFRDLLKQVKDVCLGAYAHQDLAFEKLVEVLQPERSLSHNPLVQVMLNMQNLNHESIQLPDLNIETFTDDEPSSKFDVTLYVTEADEAIQLELVYNADLFKKERILEILEQFHAILLQMADELDQTINDVSLKTKTSETIIPDPQEKLSETWVEPVHAMFTKRAIVTPDKMAVKDFRKCWSYEELEKRSNQLANYLIKHDVQPEDLIAVYASRNSKLILTLLGILKSGASFVILDPSYPKERLRKCMGAARPKGILILTDDTDTPDLFDQPLQFAAVLSDLEQRDFLLEYSDLNPNIAVKPDQQAYLAFTSGSKGVPKGVIGTHKSLAHFIQWHIQSFAFSEKDCFSMVSGLSHDPLLRDIFTPLSVSATLIIPNEEAMQSPEKLYQLLQNEKVSVMHLTPSIGRLLMEAREMHQSKEPLSIHHFFFGGEPLTKQDIKNMKTLNPDAECINFYGATETPQAMSYYKVASIVKHKNNIPIGKGIDNVQLIIMNSCQKQAGIGELGEICVRTPYLAKGYLNDRELTKKKFIRNSFTNNEDDILYRTGDMGRYLPDGNIEFAGRNDDQINLRGFRIEPGEIEAALNKHPLIEKSYVCLYDENTDKERLIAYVVCEKKFKESTEEIKQHMRQYVPNYMIPQKMIPIENLPLTPNGKVDRKALPNPNHEHFHSDREIVKPRKGIERDISEVWKEVLPEKDIGIYDNFFDLGGHSLLLVRVRSQLMKRFHRDISMVDMFKHPTIASLASLLGTTEERETGHSHIQERVKKQKETMKRRKRMEKERE